MRSVNAALLSERCSPSCSFFRLAWNPKHDGIGGCVSFLFREGKRSFRSASLNCVTKLHGFWTHAGGMLPIFTIPQIFML